MNSTKKKTFQKVIILSDSEDELMKPLKGLNKKKTLTKCYQKSQDLEIEISDEGDRFDDCNYWFYLVYLIVYI